MHPVRTRGLEVTQANVLALSAQEMTLNEKRLLVMGIANLEATDATLTARIYVNEYNRTFGENTHSNYGRLKESSSELLKRLVLIEKADGAWDMFHWVSSAHYRPGRESTDGAYIELVFEKKLRPLLVDLKANFHTYKLERIARMQSVYSVRLYEILLHTSHGGRRKRIEFELDDLKFRLRVRYKEKNKQVDQYPNFKDFRVRVLEQAQRECQEFADLTFTFTGERMGRRIGRVIFEVTAKGSLSREIGMGATRPSLTTDEMETARELAVAGYLGDTEAIVAEYGAAYIRKTVQLAQKIERDAASTSKPIHNLGGLIRRLIQSGAVQEAGSPTDEKKVTAAEIDAIARSLVDALAFARAEHAERVWSFLTDAEQAELHTDMRVTLSRVELTQLDRGNWEGPAYISLRNRILFEKHADLFPKHLSDVRAFATHEELLLQYPSDVQGKVLHTAEQL